MKQNDTQKRLKSTEVPVRTMWRYKVQTLIPLLLHVEQVVNIRGRRFAERAQQSSAVREPT